MNNIFSLAEENIPDLLKRYIAFLESCNFRASLDDFINHVNSNLFVSMNIRLGSLFHFLQEGTYKNIYEIYTNDYEKLEKNNPLFFYRFSFDSSFENGTSFKYGALNSGNIGTKFWGDFCVYLKGEKIDSSVLIKYNSLSKEPSGKYRYFDQNKDLLLDKLKNDLSNFENATPLIVLKNREYDYSKLSVNEYANLVNDGDVEYVEAIMDFSLTIDMISKIALEEEVFDKILDTNVETKDNKTEQITLTKVLKEIANKQIRLEYL